MPTQEFRREYSLTSNNNTTVGPTNAPNPNFPPGAVEAPPLLSQVAHRATKAHVFAASAASRVTSHVAIDIHTVVPITKMPSAVIA